MEAADGFTHPSSADRRKSYRPLVGRVLVPEGRRVLGTALTARRCIRRILRQTRGLGARGVVEEALGALVGGIGEGCGHTFVQPGGALLPPRPVAQHLGDRGGVARAPLRPPVALAPRRGDPP